MNGYRNPFSTDPDRREIWLMLVERDIEAFVAGDWELVAGDFQEEGFLGLDGAASGNPDSWRLTFPDLAAYRQSWLEQSRAMRERADPDAVRTGLIRATTLRDIDIAGEGAVAHKKFDGYIELRDGARERLSWQTLYLCRRIAGSWKISGFVGYLPQGNGLSPAGVGPATSTRSHGTGKRLPHGAGQHVTAGPYSPVLQVRADELVVISGQAAIAEDGVIQGEDVPSQAEVTLDNCERQLATAGCTLADVFKVNVYLTDLATWADFNRVYSARMPEPRPVRTAVQAALLPGLLVEMEMWAVKS